MGAIDWIDRKLAVEAAALGLGYASVLCWASTCLVASFGRAALAGPYWADTPWLRTDTVGVIAFAVAAVTLVVSKYLRLLRLRNGAATRQRLAPATGMLAAQAVAETAAILATGLVVYVSINAVTHGYTLRLHVIHLLPWPSEGTVRVIALIACAISVAATGYLRAAAGTGTAGLSRAGRSPWTGRSAGRDGQRQVLGDGRVSEIQQPATGPDLESRLRR